ncbi:MAG: RNA polymerase sigma-70 factor [Mastigocoleus sp. MO_167.B18]|uniref:RNA polymerase sigma-70 factor n=1 Tax=Mastigocoleus sp. MO_188.B34 TaxID=3036635 RepID=UPI002613C2BB|nr:RNA polymerase sigma-70 factor [Mastigocoleus sp. MO_188.B34]MDJ0694224.1 RNA polymerase sigma-70 factor [Mastigocoleus sp. MO_188.B34]MDJ0774588.1 RNA polymerase sigma-70 factor [Mastigocoleus sp. MO_167.B18]
MNHLESFNQYRPLLLAIAYRMLGTLTDAEDMVQETFLRWQQTGGETVKSAKSYLSTITTRLCIDHLRSARVQREQYVGPWLPEPILTKQRDDPAFQVELADSLSIAFLVILERLSPIERAVFLLREIFEYDYDEIARIVDKSPANCRQILRRSRQHIAAQRPRFPVSHQQQEQITEKFLEALHQSNLQDLVVLLAKDVTYWSDGGGQVPATLKPLHGAMKVTRFLLALRRKWLSKAVFRAIEINGQPGAIAFLNGEIHSVTTFEIIDGYIKSIYSVRNPEKLERFYQTDGYRWY